MRAVEQAIRMFEPRIDPLTLRVTLISEETQAPEESSVASFGFKIVGQIKMKPLPEALMVQAYYTPAFAQWRIESVTNGS